MTNETETLGRVSGLRKQPILDEVVHRVRPMNFGGITLSRCLC